VTGKAIFEAIMHSSDIAGKEHASSLLEHSSCAMMLEHLGWNRLPCDIFCISEIFCEGYATADLAA
jgi:isocitrate/isopropylmalate dehydrogenase